MSVVLKIILINVLFLGLIIFIGLLINLSADYVNIAGNMALYVGILIVLVHTFNKKGIIIKGILGSLTIHKDELFKYVGIQLLFVLFSITAIITVLNILFITNEDIIREIFKNTSPGQVENKSILVTIIGLSITITLAPLVEEFLFRGFLFNKWGESIGLFKAMLLSSFIFSLLHFNSGFIGHFFLGILYCTIYLKTRKLLIPILLHSLNNVIASVPMILSLLLTTNSIPSDDLGKYINQISFVLNTGTIMFIFVTPLVIYVLRILYPKGISATPYSINLLSRLY
ncbi:membrane protease YdiL (CAAX protease family) [Bacillus mesophilus]|uniref:CPBP family intramembrane metalloprotease n=1 Tax=Bacillus mesophilus TaxID=1808955 RepID=A0A6M0Q4K1_9BACI|nr:type II CAAX endopeptidase family protein [Bacillus mesophilus]MBM7661155.1 membrane protease YdiL (CAAX protease family) [Bacillus mesophilus]NEY71317.1 CPBP family intramembrane metalloprotease [Bacillus mesophilus]